MVWVHACDGHLAIVDLAPVEDVSLEEKRALARLMRWACPV